MNTNTTIEIREEKISIQGENGPSSYKALNISGRGKLVATVTGPMTAAKHYNADMVSMDDGTWALRDILDFAKAGLRGLSMAQQVA
jgi:hypothetical protein